MPIPTLWVAVGPVCQFKLTFKLVSGAVKRTSKNVLEVRFEPTKVAVKESPSATLVRSNLKSVMTGVEPKVIAKIPPPIVPAYNRLGFCASIANEETWGVVRPKFTAVQVAPASVL